MCVPEGECKALIGKRAARRGNILGRETAGLLSCLWRLFAIHSRNGYCLILSAVPHSFCTAALLYVTILNITPGVFLLVLRLAAVVILSGDESRILVESRRRIFIGARAYWNESK